MNKKEKVIETARRLFTEYGYKKVSMDEIARESNVTKKTIYTYFKDKESMFKYFIDEELKHMRLIVEKIKNSNDTFINKLGNGVYQVITYRNNSKLFSNLIKDFKDENSDKYESFSKLYDKEIIGYIEIFISEEIEKNTIKGCDVHLSAFIIYKVFISVMLEYDKEIDEKKFVSKIISIIKDGLLVKKEDE